MDTAAPLAESVLRQWADAIAARDLDVLAQMFTDNAVFIATAPAPLLGRSAIRSYYAAAPKGLTVQAETVVCAAQEEGFSIVANVIFDVPNRGALRGRLSMACTLLGQINLYHLTLAQP